MIAVNKTFFSLNVYTLNENNFQLKQAVSSQVRFLKKLSLSCDGVLCQVLQPCMTGNLLFLSQHLLRMLLFPPVRNPYVCCIEQQTGDTRPQPAKVGVHSSMLRDLRQGVKVKCLIRVQVGSICLCFVVNFKVKVLLVYSPNALFFCF